MIAKILGIVWMLLGLFWILKPEVLRKRLIKKMSRKMKWTVFGLIIMLAFSLLGVIIKAQGLLLKTLGLIGIILVVKVVLLFTSKATEKIADFWLNRPLLFFRICGLGVLAAGILLILA